MAKMCKRLIEIIYRSLSNIVMSVVDTEPDKLEKTLMAALNEMLFWPPQQKSSRNVIF